MMDARSENNLLGVHHRLVQVVRRAAEILSETDNGLGFIVIEGLRSQLRQVALVKAGASQTMNSRHLIGQAVDLAATVSGEVRWAWPLYDQIAVAMKQAAAELGVVITWGGDWKTFKDGPHFQIEPDKAQT